MTNEYASTPLELLALPFLLIGIALLWLSDKVFGRAEPALPRKPEYDREVPWRG